MSTKTIQSSVQIALQANIPTLIWGEPGIGKTSFINALAKALDVPIEVVITSIREPSDFGGLPVIRENDVMMSPPLWAKNLKKAGKGILFLDEISTAAPAVQAACLRVIHDRVVGDLELPEKVCIVAAANPPEIAAGGWDLSAPLANRFCHLDWSLDVNTWTEGMVSGWPLPKAIKLEDGWKKHIPAARSVIASFITANRAKLLDMPEDDTARGKSWSSPRSWDTASVLLAACTSIFGDQVQAKDIREEVVYLISGCVGDGAALEFVNFMKELDLPDPESIIADPTSLNINNFTRHDRLFVVLNSVVSAILAENTPNRWCAGWFVLEHVGKQGAEDLAAGAAKLLAANPPDNTTLPVKAIGFFEDIFREAGLWSNG